MPMRRANTYEEFDYWTTIARCLSNGRIEFCFNPRLGTLIMEYLHLPRANLVRGISNNGMPIRLPNWHPYWSRCDYFLVHIPKTAGNAIRWAIRSPTAMGYFGHMFGSEIPRRFWNKIIAVVRNPYDRVVSSYHFCREGGFVGQRYAMHLRSNYTNFEEFVLKGGAAKAWEFCMSFLPQFLWLHKYGVDVFREVSWHREVIYRRDLIVKTRRLCRYESLDRCLNRICGIPVGQVPKNINKSEHLPWQCYYTNPQVENIIYHLYKHDFWLFKYPRLSAHLGARNPLPQLQEYLPMILSQNVGIL